MSKEGGKINWLCVMRVGETTRIRIPLKSLVVEEWNVHFYWDMCQSVLVGR